MRLGELLMSEQLITPEKLAEALRRQVLHGGRIGTNLVELSLLPLDGLAQALGRQHHLPAATAAHFGQLDKALLEKLSPESAASWNAIPIGRTGPDASIVAIATADPLLPEVVEKLQSELESNIVQAICPELRMLYWLEAAYGIERSNRFKRAPTRAEKNGQLDERRAYVKTLADSINTSAATTVSGQLARVAVQRVSVPRSDISRVPISMLSFDEALRAIRLSNGRQRLAEQVVELLKNSFDESLSAATLLTLRDPLAIGWKGFSRDKEIQCVDDLAMPLEDSELLGPVVKIGESCVGMTGEVIPNPAPVDQLFWQYLGIPTDTNPTSLGIFPISAKEEIVGLLYVQSNIEISSDIYASLETIVTTISTTLTRLIRAANR
ncbi:MAG: hypothetical protein JKY56_21865 [Kofleriaceae bacterium]|nr:hypothetical protein [Kofleriaceae bacterium]